MAPEVQQIVAVVVSYRPEPQPLRRLLRAIVPQVSEVVVVENTPTGEGAAIAREEGVQALEIGTNLGIAAGFNRGCAWARERGARYALLFDQDSEPAPDMVEHLCAGWAAAEQAGLRVAAAGPRFEDTRGGYAPSFVKVGFPLNHPLDAPQGASHLRTDILISSGCLLNLEAVSAIGGMDESLFIDNVDVEWGFRALAASWSLVGVPQARLAHRIGDDHVPAPGWVRLLGRQRLIRHSPVRLYYIMRNRVLLYRLPHVPTAWKAQDILRVPLKLVLGTWVAEAHAASAAAMLRGLRDGLCGRRGPL